MKRYEEFILDLVLQNNPNSRSTDCHHLVWTVVMRGEKVFLDFKIYISFPRMLLREARTDLELGLLNYLFLLGTTELS